MTDKSGKVLLAFFAGQVVQVLMQRVSMSAGMWDGQRMTFCIAGGLFLVLAVVAGMLLAGESRPEPYEREATYQDYAEVPQKEKDEIMRLFDDGKK